MTNDFFISYAGKDATWAEWVGWQLTEAGYSVEIDLWDWAAGENFVLKIEGALKSAGAVIALLSGAFFESGRYTTEEWTAALVDSKRGRGRLIPLEIEPVELPLVLDTLVVPVLHGVDEVTARKRLIQAVVGPTKPTTAPSFPRGPSLLQRLDIDDRPPLPGAPPTVSNLPPRNAAFVGRASVLEQIRRGLVVDHTVAVQALHGMGGVGKTQVALEYAHQFTSSYNTIWWFDAEQIALIGEQYAALAVALDLVSADTSAAVAYRAVCSHLQGHQRWLLIFDNADNPSALRPWLAQGPGHTIITSREDGWHEIGHATMVDVLTRDESVALVRRHYGRVSSENAHLIARMLGDLPLALVQASSFLRQSGMPVSEYIAELSGHSTELLMQGTPATYSRSLASAIDITMSRLSQEDPDVAEIVYLCAYMSPEPISPEWLVSYARARSRELAPSMRDLLLQRGHFRRCIQRIANLGLVRIVSNTLVFHRLVQAVIRDGTDTDTAQRRSLTIDDVILTSRPPDPDNPTTWPAWSTLLPHIIFRAAASTASSQLREMAVDGAWFLLDRGDTRSGLELASTLYNSWLRDLGPDEANTLSAANRTAWGLRDTGRHEDARSLDADTFRRRCRVLGRDHVDTLRSASNLAADYRRIGELEAALRIDADTFCRRSGILGWNDPETLRSAVNLGADLRGLGVYGVASRLHVHARRRLLSVLGPDHPETLIAAGNLGADLRALGQVSEALTLDTDTYNQQCATLGKDHPDTLRSAMNLIDDHRTLQDGELVITIAEDLLERLCRIRGIDHIDTLRVAGELVDDLRRAGQHEKAGQLEQDISEWSAQSHATLHRTK